MLKSVSLDIPLAGPFTRLFCGAHFPGKQIKFRGRGRDTPQGTRMFAKKLAIIKDELEIRVSQNPVKL